MTNKRYENFIENWNDFFKELEEFNSPKVFGKSINDIINSGVQVFLHFPYTMNTSLFVFNQDNLEFEHRLTFPHKDFEIAEIDFSQLVDLGALSDVLQKGKTKFYPNELVIANFHFMIIPMLSQKGINGLIINKLNKIPTDLDPYYLNVCSLHSTLIANFIENHSLNSNLLHLQNLLDQKIALKTMNLTQSKRELQTILDAVQIGIVVVDLYSNSIVNVNFMTCSLTNYLQTELEGKDINFIFPNESEEIIISENEYENISSIFESSLKTKSGSLIPIIRSTAKVYFAEKKVRIDSFIDITERKHFENALKDANEMLELKVKERTIELQKVVNKMQVEISERIKAQNELLSMYNKEKDIHDMKTKFISMVSHEFRTPLTVIKTSSEILKSHSTKIDLADQINYLNRISFTVDKMTILLDDIMQIGKYDESKQIHTSAINLPELVNEIVHDILMTIGSGRNVKLSKNKEQHYVYADERLLRLIFNNILSNALKYSDVNQPVTFELICDKDFSTFIVEDKGIGIPDRDLSKIYQSFHRGSNVGTISGTGLGLSIVQKAVRDHGGNIEITSELKQGTTVKIKIPFVNTK